MFGSKQRALRQRQAISAAVRDALYRERNRVAKQKAIEKAAEPVPMFTWHVTVPGRAAAVAIDAERYATWNDELAFMIGPDTIATFSSYTAFTRGPQHVPPPPDKPAGPRLRKDMPRSEYWKTVNEVLAVLGLDKNETSELTLRTDGYSVTSALRIPGSPYLAKVPALTETVTW